MFSSRTDWNLAPNRFAVALENHQKSGKPILDLTVSNPTDCGLEYSPGKILPALASPDAFKYQPIAHGLQKARQAVADYYAMKSVAVSPDDITLTTSTSEAYSFI